MSEMPCSALKDTNTQFLLRALHVDSRCALRLGVRSYLSKAMLCLANCQKAAASADSDCDPVFLLCYAMRAYWACVSSSAQAAVGGCNVMHPVASKNCSRRMRCCMRCFSPAKGISPCSLFACDVCDIECHAVPCGPSCCGLEEGAQWLCSAPQSVQACLCGRVVRGAGQCKGPVL